MSYENEVQQAWRRLGPLGERETCEIARNADTQIAVLTERLRAVEAERDADEKLIADLVTGMDSWAAEEDHEIYADAWPAYCNARARLVWEFADQKPSGTPPKVPKLSALRAELERKDAALKDFAAAWREVAHRSGVKLEAWEDDEYILSAPERGPCGMTIHRRHATVLNAALQPTKEPPCQKA